MFSASDCRLKSPVSKKCKRLQDETLLLLPLLSTCRCGVGAPAGVTRRQSIDLHFSSMMIQRKIAEYSVNGRRKGLRDLATPKFYCPRVCFRSIQVIVYIIAKMMKDSC